MKTLCFAACATFALLVAGRASAQGTMTPTQPPPDPPPGTLPPPAPPPPSVQPAQPAQPSDPKGEQEPKPDAPPARTGFQIAVRPGVAIPMGSLAKDLAQNDVFGPQAAFNLDIGGKIIPNLFIGGYLGLNLGGTGGKTADTCKNGVTCAAASLRIGIEAQYHIIPDGKINPWVGYGIGFESSAVSRSNGLITSNISAAGPEFAHLMGGVDFRISKVFGIGPFVDFSVAQYSSGTIGTTVNGTSVTPQDIKDKAIHEWLTLGAKFVFFP
jgi:hypothetical protein